MYCNEYLDRLLPTPLPLFWLSYDMPTLRPPPFDHLPIPICQFLTYASYETCEASQPQLSRLLHTLHEWAA